MIAMFERVDPNDSPFEFTKEYIEVTVEEALEDLRTPGAGDFFGPSGAGYIRFALVPTLDECRRAAEILREL